MKFLKYLVFLFFFLSCHSYSASGFSARSPDSSVVASGSTVQAACSAMYSKYTGISQTIGGYGGTCRDRGGDIRGYYWAIDNFCDSNTYADFKGAIASQADGTMCNNGCAAKTSSTSQISDYGVDGKKISIQYFCDVNFKNCSGVVKNTGATCSGTTSGITFTDRGTAAPTEKDCGSYGTYNGQVVCLGAKKTSTAKGTATTTATTTGSGSSTSSGTSTTNSNSTTATTGDGSGSSGGTGNSNSTTTGTSTTTSNSTTTTTNTSTTTSVTNFEFDDSNIVNAVNDVSNQIKVYGEKFDGYFTTIFSDTGKAEIEALGQASNDGRVSSSQSFAQSALQNFANKLSFSNAACVRDMVINVPRFGSMTIPLSEYCDLLALLRIFLQLMTLFACLRMFDATVRWI